MVSVMVSPCLLCGLSHFDEKECHFFDTPIENDRISDEFEELLEWRGFEKEARRVLKGVKDREHRALDVPQTIAEVEVESVDPLPPIACTALILRPSMALAGLLPPIQFEKP